MTESAAKRPPRPLYYIDDERFTRFMRLEVWIYSSPVSDRTAGVFRVSRPSTPCSLVSLPLMPAHHSWTIAIWALAGLAGPVYALQASSPAGSGTNVSVATGVDDLAVLTGPESDDALRFESAKRLVLRSDEATTAALSAALRNASLPAAQREIARAITAVDPGSPRFSLALRDAVSSTSDPDCLRELLRAMDQYPARPMVATVIARLEDASLSLNARSILVAGLLRWTGCDDCARPDNGANGWTEWWSRVERYDESEWNAELAKNFRARSERAVARRDALSARIVELYNALYAATPIDRRSEVIASMLRDDLPRANRLGLDLASRALLNAQLLGDGVASASVALLSSADEEIRANSARLLENLGAPGAGQAIADALERERSARVAAPLLRLSARQSSGVPISTLLRWLRAEEPAGSAAADAILSLISADSLPDDAANDARSTLLGVEPAQFTSSQTRLLATLADDRSRDTMRQIANVSTSASARRIASLALAEHESELAFVLSGARNDPVWFEGAARAVAIHRPTASGFQELLDAAPAQGQWVDFAATTLAAMSPEERLTALRSTEDLHRREDLLGATLPLVEQADPAHSRELLLLQAETRLDLRDPEGALAALAGATRDVPAPGHRAQRVRFFALVAQGRLRDALAATPGEPAECWLEAVRRCADLPHAPEALALLVENFETTMTPSQRAQLESLRGLIANARTSPGPGAPGG